MKTGKNKATILCTRWLRKEENVKKFNSAKLKKILKW